MVHKGEIIKKIIKDNKLKITDVASQFGITTAYLYRLFEKSEVENKYFYILSKNWVSNIRDYYPQLPFTADELDEKMKGMISYEEANKLQKNIIELQSKYIGAIEELAKCREQLLVYKGNGNATKKDK